MTTLPAWARRAMREICDHILAEEPSAPADVLVFRKAGKVKLWLAPRRKNEKQKATQKRKLQGAAARRAASAERRAVVFCRIGWDCELGEHEGARALMEQHHLEGGSGRRREQEGFHNTLRACPLCHKGYHARPSDFFPAIRRWCARWLYPLPSVIRKAEASAQLPGRAAR